MQYASRFYRRRNSIGPLGPLNPFGPLRLAIVVGRVRLAGTLGLLTFLVSAELLVGGATLGLVGLRGGLTVLS